MTVYALLREQKKKRRLSRVASDILSEEDIKYTKQLKALLENTVAEAGGTKATATHEGQAGIISSLLKAGICSVDGLMRKNAHELFVLHREAGPVVEGGLGVRITVQLNLFGGSVANLGSPTQMNWLKGVFKRGELGCFCLTEMGAGVLSGLVVNTTATFIPGPSPHFDLHSPTEASKKTWISQGLTAKWGVVIARLFVPGASVNDEPVDKGPHAFIIDMTAPGIVREGMQSKTDFNGLDNANVRFEHVNLALDGMLSAMSFVDSSGRYHLVDDKVPFKFVQVAQRLLSGRICIAGAAVYQARKVLDAVTDYSRKRPIPTGRDETTPLAELPVMRDTLEEIGAVMTVLRHFTKSIEDSFIADDTISSQLVHRIACGKIESVNFCIDAILELKARVGSLSLQSNGPFGSQTDILYVYRFAEGDSSILRQKMARDRLKKIVTGPAGSLGILLELCRVPIHYLTDRSGLGHARAELSLRLVQLGFALFGKRGKSKVNAWFEAHHLVEKVAKLHARLSIYDDVADRPGLKQSRALQLYKYHFFSK